MAITTFSSRTFARDAGAVKRATANGPVFITDRGKPSLAVLDIEDYFSLVGSHDGTACHTRHRAGTAGQNPGWQRRPHSRLP